MIGRPPSCTCGECKRCKHAAYMRAWYQKKTPQERRAWTARRDKVRERERDLARNKTVKRRASLQASKDRYPEKERARILVHNAVARGKLTKLPCVICGEPRVHAHHEDYTKPLGVTWLCPRHHRERHA